MKSVITCLLCFSLFSCVTVQAALTAYLKIGDIQGESQAADHEEEIDIHDVSWTMNRSIPVNSTGSQRSRGETTLGDIQVTKYVDKSTPKLMEACASGTFFSEATFVVEKTVGGARVDYLRITMTDVIITSVSTGGSGGENRLTENVSLNCTSAEIVYSLFNDDGSLAGNVPGNVQQSDGTP